MEKVVAIEFYNIMYSEVLTAIAKAANSLTRDLYCDEDDYSKELFEKLLNEMGNTVLCYINEQKTVFKRIRDSIN